MAGASIRRYGRTSRNGWSNELLSLSVTGREIGAMSAEESTIHVIPADECYRLLGTHEIGRFGVNAQHFPMIVPVNYAMDGTTIVIRTQPGTKLAAAEYANVAFEVDEVDRRTRSGWSVLVRALAEESASSTGPTSSRAPTQPESSHGRPASAGTGCG
jgi:nitroimidazol reductase NimA-like FMN-containing flavoprotein (pyridoxamine 5'-phosphate oxidase superfamily)